jgi:DNA recombination protein RmuC
MKRQDELLERTMQLERILQSNRDVITTALSVGNDALVSGISSTNEAMLNNVKNISSATENKIVAIQSDLNKNLNDIKYNIDKTLRDVREDNEKKLGEIKNVVDEKLTKTLDERISKSFIAISERLDAVNRGLGEMQSLSSGVTDLRKVLTNVKTRGVFGEISLANLLDNILTHEQYYAQFALKKRSQETVDFAIILPGNNDKDKVYLPIDAKFPLEDYQRIVAASEAGDINSLTEATKGLERAIKIQAKKINEKYIIPPITIDFAIMYLPVEGLYAEVVRNPGLVEELQNKYKVIPAGPTTIIALLNSLQLGFRTLAIQKSSREVFDLLSKFKKDFNMYVDNISKAKSQVDSAGKTLDEASDRTRIMLKKLDKIEGINIPETDIKEIIKE